MAGTVRNNLSESHAADRKVTAHGQGTMTVELHQAASKVSSPAETNLE